MQRVYPKASIQPPSAPSTDREHVLYVFDEFTIDPQNRQLQREGNPVALSTKAFELLLILVENNRQVLEKNYLLNQLWPQTFVEEINLNVHISYLRKALGESAAHHQYIETIPKRGYRFSADIEERFEDQETFLQEASALQPPLPRLHEALAPVIPVKANVVQAVEVTEALSPIDIPGGDGLQLTPAWWSNKSRLWLFAGLLIIVMLAALALYLKRHELFSSRPVPFQKISKQKLTAHGKNMLPTLSPDGEYVAYVLDDAGKQSLWMMQVETKSCMQVIAPAEVAYDSVTFSRDGKFLYYDITDKQYQSALYQIPILGGTPRKILAEVDSHIAISPDGKQIAYVTSDLANGKTALMVASADGNDKRVLMTRQKPELVSNWGGVAWSPDGKVIACAVRRLTAPTCYMQVMTVRLDNNQESTLGPDGWADIGQIAWLDDKRGILVSAFRQEEPFFGAQLWQISYPKGEVTKLTDDLISYEGVSLAGHSRRLVTSTLERVSRIWMLNQGNSETAKQIISVMGDNRSELFGMSWTPDGQLVYGSHGGRNADIWTMNADGSNQRQLTFSESQETSPVVSPDGRYIVYVSKGAGPPHIWRMDGNGENPQQLTDGKGEQDPALSPDGRWVVYNAFNGGVMSLSRVSIDGGDAEQLTREWSIRPQVSPDGKWISFIKMDTEHKRMVVALMPFAGGEISKAFTEMPVPEHLLLRWSPDGRALHYINVANGVANIWSQPIAGGASVQITRFKSDSIFRFAWSRDGKTLALDRGMTISDVVLMNDVQER
jgi:Tol biopolymer transport system component/DNA-binding winged helix-turn-helix (wHTH) protein